MAEKKFKQFEYNEQPKRPDAQTEMDRFLSNFKGANRIMRGGGWGLAGGGSNTSTFLASSVGYSIIPSANNTYALGNGSYKWSNVATVLINGVTPKSGTATYYVAASSGGAVTTAITFNTGILT